jgi:carboxypeptidase-like protein/TonB-dependent receptor-like protein
MQRTPLVYLILLIIISLSPITSLLPQQDSIQNKYPKEFSKLISISTIDVPFEEILQIISSETGLNFNYNRNRIPLEKKLTVVFEKDSVINILKYILNLSSTELLIIAGQQILIVPSEFNQILKGKILGTIFDEETKRPLVGANVLIEDYNLGSATDANGNVGLEQIPVGSYQLRISYLGYQPVTITDIIVKSNKTIFFEQGLKLQTLLSDEVVVKSNFFILPSSETTSASNFSFEEMRRTATLGGDITRIINSLPSLSNENEANHIVARGGSTIENIFFVDNIQVPNINHFSFSGTTGGMLSILNLDFVNNINVYTGGFSSKYGDGISSIIDINYREGNSEEVEMQFDFNFGGISGQVEGPLKNNSGSWMFSAKHSFSDIIIDLIGELEQPSQFDDIQGKIVFDVSENNRLSFINIYSRDDWHTPKDYSISNYWNWYGKFKYIQNIFGMNWRYLWGENGFSNTSLSHIIRSEKTNLTTTNTDRERMSLSSSENIFQLRNINSFRHSNHFLEFGVESKLFLSKNNNNFAAGFNSYGQFKNELVVDDKLVDVKLAAFISDEWRPTNYFKITPGLRFNYFSFNQNFGISPRLSLIYYLSEKVFLTGSAGINNQSLPTFFLMQNKSFSSLKNIKACQFVFGFNWLIFDDTKLTLEVYDKEYRHLPIDQDLPTLYLLDEAIYNLFYADHKDIISGGNAFARGIEFMVQKKLTNNFYGSFSLALFRSRYKDLNGIWHDRVIDKKYLISLEGGYKISNEWEFSFRWNYSGGMAFTPFDVFLSQIFNTGIFDKKNINTERLPDYNSLSVRVDKRFNFKKANLIIYISIWNLFDRKNVSFRGWSEYYSAQVNYKLMSIVPILGLELEF